MGRKKVATRVKTRTLNATVDEAGRLIQVLFARHICAGKYGFVPALTTRQMIYRMVAVSQGISVERAKEEIEAVNKRKKRYGA